MWPLGGHIRFPARARIPQINEQKVTSISGGYRSAEVKQNCRATVCP